MCQRRIHDQGPICTYGETQTAEAIKIVSFIGTASDWYVIGAGTLLIVNTTAHPPVHS